jgi:hypothetical protein
VPPNDHTGKKPKHFPIKELVLPITNFLQYMLSSSPEFTALTYK